MPKIGPIDKARTERAELLARVKKLDMFIAMAEEFDADEIHARKTKAMEGAVDRFAEKRGMQRVKPAGRKQFFGPPIAPFILLHANFDADNGADEVRRLHAMTKGTSWDGIAIGGVMAQFYALRAKRRKEGPQEIEIPLPLDAPQTAPPADDELSAWQKKQADKRSGLRPVDVIRQIFVTSPGKTLTKEHFIDVLTQRKVPLGEHPKKTVALALGSLARGGEVKEMNGKGFMPTRNLQHPQAASASV